VSVAAPGPAVAAGAVAAAPVKGAMPIGDVGLMARSMFSNRAGRELQP
jgi:hypothetical protein